MAAKSYGAPSRGRKPAWNGAFCNKLGANWGRSFVYELFAPVASRWHFRMPPWQSQGEKPTTRPPPGAQAPSLRGMCAACCPMQKHCTPPCVPRQLVAGHPPAPGGRLRAGGLGAGAGAGQGHRMMQQSWVALMPLCTLPHQALNTGSLDGLGGRGCWEAHARPGAWL